MRSPLLSALAGLAVSVVLCTPAARAQISPGPLARPHHQLEGTANCLKCHGAKRGESMNAQCLDCHKEIAWQTTRGLGLHGKQPDRECASCHPDHAGEDFDLIFWGDGGVEAFDHAETGWPLNGRHAAIECRQCHQARFRNGPVLELIKREDRGRSWLGLTRDCVSCHVDRHAGTLGTDCTRCHSERVFKPAPSFDHAKSAYPLTGKHAEVDCGKCHLVPDRVSLTLNDGSVVPRYKPLSFAECSDCHKDPHDGRLGPACGSCHVTTDFKQVKRETFDHDKTRYPLRGKHRGLDCARCHDAERAWGKRPRFDRCDACHRDAHAGQATLGGRQVDCASCHDVAGFARSTMTAADHDRTKYPLEGRHREIDCAKCHVRHPAGVPAESLGSAAVLIRPRFAVCRDCHRDDHGGQLAAREDGGACESCHTVQAWKPSTFTVEAHKATSFPLQGRHATAECRSCHGPQRTDLPPLPPTAEIGRAGVALTPLGSQCVTCHVDPHDGRFAPDGARPFAAGCVACHGFDTFRPSAVQAATHADFAYPLEGGHRATPCFQCHRELSKPPATIHLLRVEGELRPLPFTAEHQRCVTCHASPHGDQFAHRGDPDRCESCHVVAAFRPASGFDHDRDSEFVLGRAHRTVPCVDCHKPSPGPDGKPLVVYSRAPRECKACHGPSSGIAGELPQ